MEITMTFTTLSTPARLRMPAGAFAGDACADVLGLHGTGVSAAAYTPLIVDVVKNDEFPGVHAWSPPV